MAPNLTVLLMLAQTLGASVGELTDGLAAPSRSASRSQTLAVIASRPGLSVPALAQELALPSWYVYELVRYLEATGEIAGRPSRPLQSQARAGDAR
jgi:hypothetical protein